MKNRNFIKNSIIALLPISLGLGVLLGVNKKSVERVDGYSASSPPTTIDLNDTSESDIRAYYSALNNKISSERQGTNLLKNLKTILKNGQKYYSYDSGASVWQLYEITDRDWNKSPAQSIAGYNAKTNKISGYTYGTSTTKDKGTNPYVHALYHNRDVENQATAWDSHGERSNAWTIEREHVWPKSQGFEASGSGGARGDPMHLMAADGTSNGMHSNLFYGYVDKTKTYKDAGSTHSNCAGNLTGTSMTMQANTVFEPQDSDKGDIARAIFYMVARYNYLGGSDSIDQDNPNLGLVQESQYYASYTSSTTTIGKMGVMTDLLNWHHQDPVDDYEIHRNNLLYTNFTNNRNPFIDFPEWADYIWGTVNYNGRSYVSYSSTPSGSADPQTDTVHAFNGGGSSDPVSVTGVTFEKETTSIEVGGSEVLTYSIAPSNATNKAVTWTSSNANVATVSSNGRIEGVAEGNATITITTSDGSFTDTCTVSVVASSGSDTQEFAGSSDLSDASTNTGDSEWDITNASGYYTSPNGVKLDATNEYILKNSIFSGDVSSGMTLLTVSINGKLNPSSGGAGSSIAFKVEAIDKDGKALNSITKTGSSIFSTSFGSVDFVLDSKLQGCTGIRITFDNKDNANWAIKGVSWSATYSTGVEPAASVTSIEVSTAPSKLIYTEGEDFSPAGLVLLVNYDNSTHEYVNYDDNEDFFDFEPANNLEISDTAVTISYGGKTCEQSITVNASTKTLSSISLSGQETTFDQFEDWEFGGIVTAHFSNGTEADVTSQAVFVGNTTATTGQHTVTVSYTYKDLTKSQTYTITVQEAPQSYSQRVVSKSTSQYFVTGSVYLTGSGTEGSANCDAFSVTQFKNSSNTDIAYKYDEIRVYTSHSLMITPKSGYLISSVVITANSSSYASAVGGGGLVNCTKAVDDATVTLTPSSNDEFGFVNSAQSRLNYVVVNYEKVVSYSLVTDPLALGTGDSIVFVGNYTKTDVYSQATTIVGSYLYDESSAAPSNGVINQTSNATSFKIVREGNFVSFRDDNNGYLSAALEGSSVGIHYVNNTTDRTRLSLTIDSSGIVTTSATKDTSYTHRNLKYNYNSGSPRFAFYGNAPSSQSRFSIYKKSSQTEADLWCTSFLSNTDNCNLSSWESLATSYDSLSSSAQKEIISCIAMDDSNYCKRSQAMARYEYILSHYEVSNFITGRNVSPAKPNILPVLFGKRANNVAVIIVISLISVSAIGGYFFLRTRKKEEF